MIEFMIEFMIDFILELTFRRAFVRDSAIEGFSQMPFLGLGLRLTGCVSWTVFQKTAQADQIENAQKHLADQDPPEITGDAYIRDRKEDKA